MSELLESFHFLRPWWLTALVPLAVICRWLAQGQAGHQSWRRICDSHLLDALLERGNGGNGRGVLWLLAGGWLAATVALAGPTWSRTPQPVFLQSLATRIIVLDLSRSMTATDLNPSRMVRARYKVADILTRSEDTQNALVVFAGDAFVVSPITRDADTIGKLLHVLEPSLMPVQGSRVDLGLAKAKELLEQSGTARASVVLITDGGNGGPSIDAARALAEAGYPVSVLGVGTAQGAAVKTSDGDLLKDASGAIVIPRLSASELAAIAAAGGGRYAAIAADSSDLNGLLVSGDSVLASWQDVAEPSDREAETWQEQGPWLVLALLPLAALAFRRGWLLACALWVAAPLPQAQAWSLQDLYLRPDQQAARALAQGNPRLAAELAPGAWQRGTAAFRAGDYQQALAAFSEVPGAEGDYNRGNALIHLGRHQEALEAYTAALEQDPGMVDAIRNLGIAVHIIALQEKRKQRDEKGNRDPQSSERKQSEKNQQPANRPRQSDDSDNANSSDDQSSDEPAPNDEKNDDDPDSNDATPPDPDKSDEEQATERQLAANEDGLSDEQRQVLEQWLRRIPDDPGTLLKRKFRYQYQRRASPVQPGQPKW